MVFLNFEVWVKEFNIFDLRFRFSTSKPGRVFDWIFLRQQISTSPKFRDQNSEKPTRTSRLSASEHISY